MPMVLFKFFAYLRLYGFGRTLIKIFGRKRWAFPLWVFFRPHRVVFKPKRKVLLIGAGQHAYSSIAYFLLASSDSPASFVYDIDYRKSYSLGESFGVEVIRELPEKLSDLGVDLVYIASNHASHFTYALRCLEQGIDTFVEKPLCLSLEQLSSLDRAVRSSGNALYIGYNRPFSPFSRLAKSKIKNHDKSISLLFNVFGHALDPDHWYRQEVEGNRVTSNLGHWLDLSFDILAHNNRGLESIEVTASWSDESLRSDNISICMLTNLGDVVTIAFNTRHEPYAGVYEYCSYQDDNVTLITDDHRNLIVEQFGSRRKIKYWTKQNGHKECVLQPFQNRCQRSWDMIRASTSLILHVSNMVEGKVRRSTWSVISGSQS